MLERIAFVEGVRTPFCKAGTALKDVPADELGRIAVAELLYRAELDPKKIDHVVIGNVSQPPEAANIARVIALKAGIPQPVPAYTVHRNCASGFEALTSAAEKIWAGQAAIVVAGGTESMSNIPLLFGKELTEVYAALQKAKTLSQKLSVLSRLRPQHLQPLIGVMMGLTDPVCGLNMGETAEVLARDFKISRKMQDEFALLSHQRAVAAIKAGAFKDEIIPTPAADGKIIIEDIGPRADSTLEKLSTLKPVFDKRYGTVTAGNSSMITDGAAMTLVMTESRANELGYAPLGYLRSYAYAGCDPKRMGLGPSFATPVALRHAQMTLKDIDLIELNEAFAAVVLANEILFRSADHAKALGLSQPIGEIDIEKLNVNGGAIALGHPVGSSGTRLVLTLLCELKRRNKSTGLATLCVGGGQGGALILERN